MLSTSARTRCSSPGSTRSATRELPGVTASALRSRSSEAANCGRGCAFRLNTAAADSGGAAGGGGGSAANTDTPLPPAAPAAGESAAPRALGGAGSGSKNVDTASEMAREEGTLRNVVMPVDRA
jgi:hypothetical protein